MTEQRKAEAKKTGWEEWANRTTAILAVVAALSSGRWGASNLQAILEQGKVNDTWAYYQAKSLKQQGAEQMRDFARALIPGETPERAASLEKLQATLDKHAKAEEKDKLLRQKHALEFEIRRDRLVESSFWFEISFTGFQLGVILCTIATGTKRRWPWTAGIVCGALGLIILVNGFAHFYHAPRSWYQGVSAEMSYEGTPTSAPAASAPGQ
jgi:hypothetical protein